MKKSVRYAPTIHEDRTIAKWEMWECETEEEFWKIYDSLSSSLLTANIDTLTITVREYISVEQYRKEVE